jgi:hypothetical protein
VDLLSKRHFSVNSKDDSNLFMYLNGLSTFSTTLKKEWLVHTAIVSNDQTMEKCVGGVTELQFSRLQSFVESNYEVVVGEDTTRKSLLFKMYSYDNGEHKRAVAAAYSRQIFGQISIGIHELWLETFAKMKDLNLVGAILTPAFVERLVKREIMISNYTY